MPAEWEEGQAILDLYEVKKVHTGGGMGLVYKVHHKNWNIALAVKSPRPDYFKTEAQKENFIRECETWINLGLHPNIVSCYYVRTLGGIPRVFAEYVEGGSLKDWIDNKKLYEGDKDKALERILDIAIQFAWGLHYAHEQGLVHQDVKPANVMMAPDGTAKVTDFGLAKARATAGEAVAGGPEKSILVSSGGMTPAYCSPEQAEGKPLTRRTDIWSWAVSVLEMFNGEVTWRAGQIAPEILESFLETGAEDESIPKMPKTLAGLLRQCFQENPDERPEDMQEVAAKLRDIYKGGRLGQEYSRPEPKAADLLADGLNNKAVSMLDLDKKDEAERLYEQALKADPHHPQATYNRGLLLWRSGLMTDDQLIKKLEEVHTTHMDDWRDKYLLGLVHIERGDAEAAVKALEEATKQAPNESCVKSALKTARGGIESWGRRIQSFEGHGRHEVQDVAIYVEENLVVSAGGTTAKVWSLKSNECTRELRHEGIVTSIAFFLDGRLLATGQDGVVRIWDLVGCGEWKSFRLPALGVNALAFSADGCFILSACSNIRAPSEHFLQLWDISQERCVHTYATYNGHQGTVHTVAISPNGILGLSGGEDGIIRMWDVATGKSLGILGKHEQAVHSIKISPCADFALSGSWGGVGGHIKAWDLKSQKCIRTIKADAIGVNSVAISSDGYFALSAGNDGTVRLWDTVTSKCLRTFMGTGPVAISGDARFACWGRSDGALDFWQLRVGELQNEVLSCPTKLPELMERSDQQLGYKSQAECALAEGNGQNAFEIINRALQLPGYERVSELLELRNRAGRLGRILSFSSAWLVREFKGHEKTINSVALSHDNRFAVTGSSDCVIRLWDLATGECIRLFQGHDGEVTSVAFSWGRDVILSGSADKTVRLWEMNSGRCLAVLKGHRAPILSMSVSPDGLFILTGSGLLRPFCRQYSLRLWSISAQRCLRTSVPGSGAISAVKFTPNGSCALFVGLTELSLEIINLCSRRKLAHLEGHSEMVFSVAVSRDGNFALSSGRKGFQGGVVKLWELATGKCLKTVTEFGNWVCTARFVPGTSTFLSGDGTGSLKLWDLHTCECVKSLHAHDGFINSTEISDDSRFILSGGGDRILRLWELAWNYDFPTPEDWDERARPYLETFLTLHTPYAGRLPQGREPSEEEVRLALTRRGKPQWTEADFKELRYTLGCAGYGWLRPEGVRKKLEEMSANWQGPPPLLGKG